MRPLDKRNRLNVNVVERKKYFIPYVYRYVFM